MTIETKRSFDICELGELLHCLEYLSNDEDGGVTLNCVFMWDGGFMLMKAKKEECVYLAKALWAEALFRDFQTLGRGSSRRVLLHIMKSTRCCEGCVDER